MRAEPGNSLGVAGDSKNEWVAGDHHIVYSMDHHIPN